MAGLEIDYVGHPSASLDDLLAKYKTSFVIMEDIMQTDKQYEAVYQDFLDIMKWGFEDENIRHMPIGFKMHSSDKGLITMQIRHLLSNMILWYAFVKTDSSEILDESFIFPFDKNFNMGMIEKYINEKILTNIADVDRYTKNEIVDEIIHHMTAISRAFSPLMGLGISVYSIQQAAKRNPRIEEIMFGKVDPNLQPVEIEKILSDRTDELIACFSNDSGENDLKPLFLSGNNLSKGQFKEIAVMIGLKADVNGNTIPHLIDKNILVDGISSPSAYYIDSSSGRKSLILSKTRMGEPGAFSKKATTNTTAATLRRDYLACNTVRPIWYHITNDKFLKLLDKRYYYDDLGNLHLLRYDADKHLIGQDVAFRSPCTCSSKDGVCHICYGDLFDENKDLASAGAYAATKETEPLGQMILSNKHSQVTHSDPITFDQNFNNVFEVNSNEITVRDDAEMPVDMYLVLDNVHEEETEDTVNFYCEAFDIVESNSKLLFHVEEEHHAKLYLTKQLSDMWRRLKDKSKPISLDFFDDDSAVLFNVEIKNKETTEPTQNINKLLNTNDKCGCRTLDDVCQKMAENKIDAGINFNLVHDEMIIRQLIRKKSNDMEFPDWSANGDLEDYQILRLNDALFKNPSPVVSLSYGYLRKQLLSPELYQKTAPSHLDPLFIANLSSVIDEDT